MFLVLSHNCQTYYYPFGTPDESGLHNLLLSISFRKNAFHISALIHVLLKYAAPYQSLGIVLYNQELT